MNFLTAPPPRQRGAPGRWAEKKPYTTQCPILLRGQRGDPGYHTIHDPMPKTPESKLSALYLTITDRCIRAPWKPYRMARNGRVTGRHATSVPHARVLRFMAQRNQLLEERGQRDAPGKACMEQNIVKKRQRRSSSS